VFHCGGKVTRLVTQRELMDAYNLELSVQRALKTLGKNTSGSCEMYRAKDTSSLDL